MTALRNTPGSNFPAGGVFTNSTLRGSAQAVLARADTPDPIRVLICGHLLTDASVVNGPQDTNLKNYTRPLNREIDDMIRVARVLASNGNVSFKQDPPA